MTEAVDGQDGLDQASKASFSVMIIDVNMPNMDGLTFTRELSASERYERTPIMMLTTESSAEMKAQGKAAGLTGWMVKPFHPQTLLAVIGKLLP